MSARMQPLWFIGAAVGFAVAALVGCAPGGGGPTPTPSATPTATPTPAPAACDASNPNAGLLTAEEKLRADRLISVFENDTIELQYAYIENLNDGRGYTAGRAGFTTATHDLLLVVERYVEDVPDSPLAAYLPRLRELSDQESDDVTGLEGFPAAWTAAAEDQRLRTVQDEVVDEEYYRPAMAQACALNLVTPLARVEIYDTNLQHGAGEDPDGLPAIIQRTNDRLGGSPATGVDERAWFAAFLEVRRATLENAFDPETRDAWAESVYRVEIVQAIANSGNFDFTGPIIVDHPEHQATIP